MAQGNVLLRPSPDELAALEGAVRRSRLSKAEIFRQAQALWLDMYDRGQLSTALIRAGYLPPDGRVPGEGARDAARGSPWDEIMQGGG